MAGTFYSKYVGVGGGGGGGGVTSLNDLTGALTLAAGSGISVTDNALDTITIACTLTQGVTTVGTIDSQSKSANGLVISTTNIYAQTADATYPGMVSTGTQTFAGAKTFNENMNLAIGKVYQINGAQIKTTNLLDVSSETPALDNVFSWDGIQWVPKANTSVAGGMSFTLWPNQTAIITGPDATTSVYTLLTSPTVSGATASSATVTAATSPSLIDIHLYNTALGITQIPSGAWEFNIFADTTNVTGANQIEVAVDKVVAGAGTATVTGAGTTRTVTATSSMFVAGDFNADPILTSYVQLPGGIFPIAAYTSATVVDITTPVGYVNDGAGSTYSAHRNLFSGNTIDITSTSGLLYQSSNAQGAFAVGLTDKLSLFFWASTDSVISRTISYYQDGTTENTSIITPLALDHNALAGLQGGTTGEYYHLTAAQKTVATQAASGSQNGYLASADWTTFNNKQNALTFGDLTDVGTDGISVTSGTGAVIGSGTSISQHVSDASHNGYLSSTDWSTFNGKQAALTFGNFTDVGTDGITVTNGTGSVIGTGTSISQHVADSTHNGYLSSTDWSTFNAKQSALTFGNLTDVGTDGISVTSGTGAVIGSGTSIAQQVSDATHNGYLSSTDWNTFNNKQPAGSYATTTLNNLGTTAINADLIFSKVTPIIKSADTTGANSEDIAVQSGATTVGSVDSGAVNLTTGDSAVARSGGINVTTGTGPTSSGGITIATGGRSGTSTATTGTITIKTGDNTSSGGTNGGAMTIRTGNNTNTSTTFTSGALTLQSGNTNSTSNSSATGSVTLQSGNRTSASGTASSGSVTVTSGTNAGSGAARSGNVTVSTGTTTSSTTGDATFSSGNGVGSGAVQLSSGTASGASTGTITIVSGVGSSGSGLLSISSGIHSAAGGTSTTGSLTLATGNNSSSGTGASGNSAITTGNKTSGTANSGSITLTTGTSTATRGEVKIDATQLNMNSTKIINVTDPAAAQDASTMNYTDTKIAKSTLSAKGSLVGATAASTPADVAVGTNGTFLKADSSISTGVTWTSTISTAATRSVTTTDACTNADDVLILSGASFTETLFTAVGNTGKILTLIHNGTNLTQVYTLNTTSGQTIGGIASGTYKLGTFQETLRIISDGANWLILGHFAETTWVAYTPTIAGAGTPTNMSAFWKREGEDLLVKFYFLPGTTTAVTATVSLPSTLTINTALIIANQAERVGLCVAGVTTTLTGLPATTIGPFPVAVDTADNTTVYVTESTDKDETLYAKRNGTVVWNSSGDVVAGDFRVTVNQWQP